LATELKRPWLLSMLAPAGLALLGKALGPLGEGYPAKGLHYLFYVPAASVVFFLIPALRRRLLRRGRKTAAFLGTWALGASLGLLGLGAYLWAADEATFWGLIIASAIVLAHFRP
jgi:hypothetical protein